MSIHAIAANLTGVTSKKADGVSYEAIRTEGHFGQGAVHDGKIFLVTAYGTFTATEELDIHLKTPATKRMHFYGEYSGSGAITASLIENPTIPGVPVSETTLAVWNADLESSVTPTMVAVTVTDTDLTDGDTMQKTQLGGGLQGRTGGSAIDPIAILLEQDQDYAMQIASGAAGNIITFNGFWIEEST